MTLRFKTLPPTTNHLYGRTGGYTYVLPAVRSAKAAIGWEARSQFKGEPLTGPLSVEVQLFWPNRRKHDIDNIKALLDALTGIVWQDDSQIVRLVTEKAVDAQNPRVELTVEPQPVLP